MTATGISGAGPGGVLRMTRVQDRPARVLEHSDAGEPSGTWTGLACPNHGLPTGADVRRLCASCRAFQLADLIWETPRNLAARLFRQPSAPLTAAAPRPPAVLQQARTLWSQAWTATRAGLGLVRHAGVTRSLGSNRSAGSWPRPGAISARTASGGRTSQRVLMNLTTGFSARL
jgi:hypothetical protein